MKKIIKVLPPVITIDGPSAAGKGTLSKMISNYLGWNILESGKLYRILALAALKKKINLNNKNKLINLTKNFNYYILNNKKILNDVKINMYIYNEKIAHLASIISKIYKIRKILLNTQRNFRMFPGLVTDGRDMGTLVFPDAPVKIFLYASLEERARRRRLQLYNNGLNVNIKNIINNIKTRDERDINCKYSPLYPAYDALLIDSTNISINEVFNTIRYYIFYKIPSTYRKYI